MTDVTARHPRSPAICERCDGKITDEAGWGVLLLCSVQSQPGTDAKDRELSLFMCGYCMNGLGKWLCPDVEEA